MTTAVRVGGKRPAPEGAFLVANPDTRGGHVRRRFVDEPEHEMKIDWAIVGERFINMTATRSGGYYQQQFAHFMIDTRDKAIREALIALGWTPPPEVKP